MSKRAGKGGGLNIELAVAIVVFGPIILIRFLRSLANRVRRSRALTSLPRLQPKYGLKRKLTPQNNRRARSA